MASNKDVVREKLTTLEKIRTHLEYVFGVVTEKSIRTKNIRDLSEDDDLVFSAFRMRFSEYQEHLGKLIMSVAREEDVNISGRSDLVSFAEKFGFIESEKEWNIARDIRNDINHNYIDDDGDLKEHVSCMLDCVDTLTTINERVSMFCRKKYFERLGGV